MEFHKQVAVMPAMYYFDVDLSMLILLYLRCQLNVVEWRTWSLERLYVSRIQCLVTCITSTSFFNLVTTVRPSRVIDK